MKRKPEPWDRRRFVRRAGGSALLAPFVPGWLAACAEGAERDATRDGAGAGGGQDAPGSAGSPSSTGSGGLRAVALPGAGIALLDPGEPPPAAYVSRARRTVRVERAWRDRAHFLLGAYTSVSTGHWRIPLPGDDPRAPIAPGDEAREFEAVDMDGSSVAVLPAPGDLRVWPGRPVTRSVEAACLPVEAAARQWLVGGPWRVDRYDGERGGTHRTDPGPWPAGREVFGALGSGTIHAAPDCSGGGVTVEVFGWRALSVGAGGSAGLEPAP